LSESALLRILREAIGSSPEMAKRHIIHFKNKSAYSRFLTAFKKANELFPVKAVIQPFKIIPAIACTLKPGSRSITHPSIRYVEENASIRVHAPPALYLQQSPVLRQPGASVPWGVRQIKSPDAWKETRGGRIRIGVIDTGIDYMHPDLRGRISRGINLLHSSMLPTDDNGHGTHISGTIAASNPDSGIVGVAPGAIIHPVKAFDHNGTAFVSDIVQGVDWCVRNRMHIINMSFGMKIRSKSLHDAVRNAHKMGIVVVASSGNEGKHSSIDYPARFAQAISVGATSSHKKIAPFSNRGKSIDLYAPGDKIKSTWLQHKYMELSGTSMATSHVSGVIALMLAAKPSLTPGEIKSLLQKTSNPISGLKSRAGIRGGEIDAARVLRHLG
jgi:subtilisin family serine protease